VSGERVRGRENRDGLVLVEESGRGGAEDGAERNHGLEASQVEGGGRWMGVKAKMSGGKSGGEFVKRGPTGQMS